MMMVMMKVDKLLNKETKVNQTKPNQDSNMINNEVINKKPNINCCQLCNIKHYLYCKHLKYTNSFTNFKNLPRI